ncbi:hypothetical protein L195_g006794, partial [Trifolium pratense]
MYTYTSPSLHPILHFRTVDAETAGVEALLANEIPGPKEAVDADEVGAVLPTPKLNVDPPLTDGEPDTLYTTGAAVDENPPLAGAEDAAFAPKAGTDAETIAAPVAVVEAVVVVTVEVENKGSEDVENDKPAGFEAAGVPETAEAVNPDELDDVVAVIVLAGAECFPKGGNDVVVVEVEEAFVENVFENKEFVVVVAEDDDEIMDEPVNDENDAVPAEVEDPPNGVVVEEDIPPNDVVAAEPVPPNGVVEVVDGNPNDGAEAADAGAPNTEEGAEADDGAPNRVDEAEEAPPPNSVVEAGAEADAAPPNIDVEVGVEADDVPPKSVEAGAAPPNIDVEVGVEADAAPPNIDVEAGVEADGVPPPKRFVAGVEADCVPPKRFVAGVEGVPPNGEPVVVEPKIDGAEATGAEEPVEEPKIDGAEATGAGEAEDEPNMEEDAVKEEDAKLKGEAV